MLQPYDELVTVAACRAPQLCGGRAYIPQSPTAQSILFAGLVLVHDCCCWSPVMWQFSVWHTTVSGLGALLVQATL